MQRAVGATERVQWLERGSVSFIECYCVNANIALTLKSLSGCNANVVVCIQHVVAKMYFTNVEALGHA